MLLNQVKFEIFPTIPFNNFYSGSYVVETFPRYNQILDPRHLLKSILYFDINLTPAALFIYLFLKAWNQNHVIQLKPICTCSCFLSKELLLENYVNLSIASYSFI